MLFSICFGYWEGVAVTCVEVDNGGGTVGLGLTLVLVGVRGLL